MADDALVIFSGGQDSTTCLAWALQRFDRVRTVGFTYGQRHVVEMSCREVLRAALGAMHPLWARRLGEDQVLDIDLFRQLGGTALTEDMEIRMTEQGLPNTFVPGRNLLFLTLAAICAWRQGARHIVMGVCETDFSGYPDCRDDAVKAMQVALNIGMDTRLTVHTPLMWIDKAATWELAHALGGDPLVECILEHSHTCYLGDRSRRHAWGYGCGHCPACRLRAAGYDAFAARRVSGGSRA